MRLGQKARGKKLAKKSVFVPISLILASLILPFLLIQPTPNASASLGWWDTSWTRRRPITITGSHPENYQLKIIIPYDSDMRSDYGDLRFTENEDGTELNYWIENYTADNATVWVRRLENLTPDDTIYVYYGNPAATSASNGDATFGADVGFDSANGWSEYDPNNQMTITGGLLQVRFTSSGATSYYTYHTLPSGVGDFYVKERIEKLSGDGAVTGSRVDFGFSDTLSDLRTATNAVYGMFNYYTSTNIRVYLAKKEGGVYTYAGPINGLSQDAYYTFVLTRVGSTATLHVYDNAGNEVTGSPLSLTVPTTAFPYFMPATTNSTGNSGRPWHSDHDHAIFCKYVSPEPTVSVGSEIAYPSVTLGIDNNHIFTSSSGTLVWSWTAGVTLFRIQIDDNSDFGSTLIDNDTLTDNSYTFDLGNWCYYWRARAYSPSLSMWSDWSENRVFYVIAPYQPPSISKIATKASNLPQFIIFLIFGLTIGLLLGAGAIRRGD